MSKPKAPSLPSVPEFQANPIFQEGAEDLLGLGQQLTSFDLTGGLAPLADVINVNPDVVAGMFAGLEPYFRDISQNTINELAANNQLESSVTANRLGQIESDFQNALLANTVPLIQSALQNRLNIFGTGLNTLNQATAFGLEGQNQLNTFNLANFENQVAKAVAEQKPRRGGITGALTGGVGGALTGLALAPFTGGASLIPSLVGGVGGAVAGGFGTPGTGGNLLTSGLSLAGSSFVPQTSRALPGSTASNDPFDLRGIPGLTDSNPFDQSIFAFS